ncbi:ABC transporter substrate-binding protein [Bifidobacterium sp. ESL0798]|uniref:ABC transporter substrate-binding protein n=1 Tax=unclassified Bifidobacterium TaxID=2608897 RepID=UPI0023F861D8|nr:MULTISPECIES: ABC transporter substrate-binding protein [unclassified Bifidobacterium]WEV52778.1 ABC transporter substrate-binding protein [Bifidobacterium sp. ESL0704]WEV74224.1 ABC transporter substrate-binding protein [Bifidobacterium sp. ESL0798]
MSRHKQQMSGPMRGLVFLGAAAVLFALVGVGWAHFDHRSVDATLLHSGSEVTVGLDATAPQSLDIRTVQGKELDQALLGNVYETLVGRDQDNKLVPSIAKSWDVSKDGLNYTFTLNADMRFANGDALDSTDVVYSLQQVINRNYVGSEDLTGLKSVKNPDTSTVQISLSSPNPRLLRALSSRAGIVYDSTSNINYAKQAGGSGPFTVRSFDPGNSIVFTRNPLYWKQQSASSQMTLRYFDSVQSLGKAMKDGTVQLAVLRPSDSPKPFQGSKKYSVSKGLTTSKLTLALNNSSDSIFSDERARSAVRYILDNEAITKSQPNAASVLNGPISPLEPGYDDLSAIFPHNLDAGKNDLNYWITRPGYFGDITFLVPDEYASLGQQVLDQFKTTQLHLVMQVVDDDTLRQRLDNGDYKMAIVAMQGPDDLGAFAEGRFGYQNSEAQQDYRNALASTNDIDYQQNLRAYAKTVSSDAGSAWFYNESSMVAADNNIAGYPRNMTDELLPLRDVSTK